MPLFSVVIPTHNRADLLTAALDSVAAQTFRDFEVVVADDGSTDDTAAVVGRYPFARYARQPNAGPGAARNLGLRHATGDYVAFLDSDDLWFPWTLAVYARAIERHGEPSVVVGRAFELSDPAEMGNVCEEPLATDARHDFLATAGRECWYGTPALVARRDAVAAAGGFTSERVNAEDLDLLLRLGTAPGCVIVDAPRTFAYRRHMGSAVSCLPRTAAGLGRLIESERGGRYPGGSGRRAERRELLARFVRPHVVAAAAAGHLRASFNLYARSLWWNVRLRRGRYLVGVLVVAFGALVRRLIGRRAR